MPTTDICKHETHQISFVKTWREGERIELEWEGVGLAHHILAGCWGIPPGALLAALVWFTPWGWFLAPLVFCFACWLPGWIDWRFYRRRRFVFDINGEQIEWTVGKRSKTAPLAEVKSFDQRGLLVMTTVSVGMPPVTTEHFIGRLFVTVGRRQIAIANSLEEIWGATAPYAALRELQTALSKELSIERGEQEDYRGTGLGWLLRRPFFPWFPSHPL